MRVPIRTNLIHDSRIDRGGRLLAAWEEPELLVPNFERLSPLFAELGTSRPCALCASRPPLDLTISRTFGKTPRRVAAGRSGGTLCPVRCMWSPRHRGVSRRLQYWVRGLPADRRALGALAPVHVACGHVGYCDSSPHRHATAHRRAKPSDPIIRSIEPGEDWWWCYEADVAFEGSSAAKLERTRSSSTARAARTLKTPGREREAPPTRRAGGTGTLAQSQRANSHERRCSSDAAPNTRASPERRARSWDPMRA